MKSIDEYKAHIASLMSDNGKMAGQFCQIHKYCDQMGIDKKNFNGEPLKGSERVKLLMIECNLLNIQLERFKVIFKNA